MGLTVARGSKASPSALLTGAIVRPLLRLGAPMIAVLVAQSLIGLAETFYLGLLGTDALAGAALVFPLSMLMTMVANGGIGGGVSSAVARSIGAGRQGDADALTLHALVLAAVFGLAFTFGMIAFGPSLFAALGGRGAVLKAATTYSDFVFAAAVPTWIANLLAAALRGVGNVRVPALVTMLGCVILVPLSPLLIFGFGPIPRFGVAGAGMAIIIYYLGASLFLVLYLLRGRGGLTLRRSPLEWRLMAAILKVGLISAVGATIANLTVIIVTGLVGRFGADALAGYGAGSRLDYIQIPFLFGFGTAVVTMVGVNVGAGQHARARRIAWTGALIAAGVTETLGLVAAAFPHLWIGIFSRDPAVLASGTAYLQRVAPVYGAVGAGMLLYFAAQGTGRMLIPFLAGLSRLGIAAGVGALLVTRFGASLGTLFLAVAGGAIAFGALNALGMLLSAPSSVERRPAQPGRRLGVRVKAALGTAAVAILLSLGALTLSRRGPEAAPPSPRQPVVRVETIRAASFGSARFTGVVHARYESALGFRVAGKIVARLVDPGDRVHKGQPLMRLDETDFALALKAAHEAVEAARATSIQAASDEKRRRSLVGEGWVTPQTYEQNKAQADASAAQLRSALSQEKIAEDQASYSVLQADADGVIMDVPTDPGQVVAAGQPVLHLAHDGPREAEVYLPEGSVRAAGDVATATLYAHPDDRLVAKLRELSAVADPATRTYRARYVLGGKGAQAPLGATVTLTLSDSGSAGTHYDIPIGALFDAGDGPSIWIIDPKTSVVAARPVNVLQMGEERAVVGGDLHVGDKVVALGAHLLKAGETVETATNAFDTAAQ